MKNLMTTLMVIAFASPALANTASKVGFIDLQKAVQATASGKKSQRIS